MLIELTLLSVGGLAGLWKYTQSKQLTSQPPAKTKTNHSFSLSRLVQDLRDTTQATSQQALQLDIDPKRRQAMAAEQQKNRRKMLYSLGATGLALLGSLYPVFTIAGIAAVLYLSREMFILIYKDFKRGHYLSVYLLGLMMTLAMIATGNIVLAAFAGFLGSFFAGIINRLEDNSQQQLISVFSGHPEQVWLLRDGVEVQVDFHTLQAGDLVIVNAGEVIPADGYIHSGEGQIDQHLLTGESKPVEKSVGETVFAATLLLSGRLAIEVTTAGNETMAAKIGDVLNQTQSYKNTLMTRGRKMADRFLPVQIGISATTLPLLGPSAAVAVMWSNLGGIMAPLGSLSVLSYLKILSRQNILVKDGRIFESLRQVDTVVFDKTGTLTLEQPTVGAIHPLNGFDELTVLKYAAAAEYRQPHPIAKAILAKAAAAQVTLPTMETASYEVGYGIQVRVEGQLIRVGSARFMQREGIDAPAELSPIQQQAEQHSHSLLLSVANWPGYWKCTPPFAPKLPVSSNTSNNGASNFTSSLATM